MRSGKSRLLDVTAPVSVAYADKPLNLGGVIRPISIAELERIVARPAHPYSRKPLTLLAKILFCAHLITETASNNFIFIS
jgi:hypothetical protein